jgi:fused signal recognition particle receptor
MSPIVYVLIAVAVVAILFFVMRKPGQPELPEKPEPKKLSGREEEEEAPKPAKKPAEKKAPPPKKEAAEAPREEPKPAPKREEAKPIVEEAKAPVVEEEPAPKREEPKPEKPSAKSIDEDFGKPVVLDPAVLRKGLARTRGGMIARLASLFRGRTEIDPAVLAEMEEILLTSDVGVKTTQALVQRMMARLEAKELGDAEKVWAALRAEAEALLGGGGKLRLKSKPEVVMVVGVNGSGKTTTIGKLASKLKAQGKSVVLGAGDTFRAAAVQQLEVWGEREGAMVIKGREGADPSSVLFEAVNMAKESNADVLLCDTAGRLHTKTNLMEELQKVRRTIGKALDGAPHETLLVLDATNGQNAIEQAKQFKEAIDITGVVLTKLDGTAKGGVILAIADELKLPVRYIGIGERAADLREFDAAEFVEALLGGRDAISTEAA